MGAMGAMGAMGPTGTPGPRGEIGDVGPNAASNPTYIDSLYIERLDVNAFASITQGHLI
jgi:hypothetical protein